MTGQEQLTDDMEIKDQQKTLTQIPLEKLTQMLVAELKDLCKSEGLPMKGKKADLLKVLKAKKLGGDSNYVPGQTLCRFCREPVDVTGTKRRDLEDGRFLVIRQLRCRGKRSHRYPTKEIVGEKKMKTES